MERAPSNEEIRITDPRPGLVAPSEHGVRRIVAAAERLTAAATSEAERKRVVGIIKEVYKKRKGRAYGCAKDCTITVAGWTAMNGNLFGPKGSRLKR
jgi:hypothetical protein